MEEFLTVLIADPDRTNAIAAFASAIAAFMSLIVATIAIIVSVKSVRLQDRHNQVSVKPVARFTLSTAPGEIAIFLNNYGVGPLVIKSFCVTRNDMTTNDITKFFPIPINGILKRSSPTFITEGATIPSGSFIEIFSMELNENVPGFDKFRREILNIVNDLEFSVSFTDIYDNKFNNHIRVFSDK